MGSSVMVQYTPSLDFFPLKEEAEHWGVLWLYSLKTDRGRKRPGDSIIPGLTSLAWAFSPFFSCNVIIFQNTFICSKTLEYWLGCWEKWVLILAFSSANIMTLDNPLHLSASISSSVTSVHWTRQFLRYCDFFDPYQKVLGNNYDIS